MLTPLDLDVIDLDVIVKQGRVIRATSSGNKLRGYEKAFVGMDPYQLYSVIPRVLSTCAQSHVFAYADAVLDLHENTMKAMKTMLILEIIDSHVRHPYTYWFPYIGGKEFDFPTGEKFRRISILSKKIRELMMKIGGKWPNIEYMKDGRRISLRKEDINQLMKDWESLTLGMTLDEFLQLSKIEELRGDLSLFSKVPLWRSGLGNYLTVGFPFDGEVRYEELEDKGNEITYNRRKVEVGPLAQALTFDPMIKGLHNKMGPSPLLRELSRLRVAAHLMKMLDEMEVESDGYALKGSGVGKVESIRGSLIHQVEMNGTVNGYTIIQPTTFIASPKGALESAVTGIPVYDPKNPWELSLAVSSLDSCFITEVKIYENEKLVHSKRIGGFC